MTRVSIVFSIIVLIVSCSKQKSTKEELTATVKSNLIAELQQMKHLDQLNRSFLSVGTLSQALVDSVSALPVMDQFSFRPKIELTKVQRDSLWKIQHKIDLKNTNRLFSIIETYGWLNKTKLDSLVDPMIFLFHTPMETIDKMKGLLLTEVNEQRMPPIMYATYVDNMRKKAYGEHQLYGTGDEFDPAINAVVPPFIEDINRTNTERIKIGLPKLEEGEYRTNK